MSQSILESRILVVDDEPANLQLLQRLLDIEGYENVLGIQDPREVAGVWESFQPDLVLLDLMMPHLNGYDLMEQLGISSQSERGEYVPVLVLTADATSRSLDRALSTGARDFLTKPFDHNEVRLRIKNLLETRALHVALSRSNEVLEETVRERTAHLSTSLEELRQAHDDLKWSREETIERLSMSAELRDDDTGKHIKRMSRYCGILGRTTGMSDEETERLVMASQMHDVGKIGIPDSVLRKPGKLDPQERAMMERHAEIGHRVLSGSRSDLLILAADIALTHHERVDGSGYPRKLGGDDIPLEGRIAAIADVFDALTSDRVYRAAMPIDDAIALMKRDRGSHFDAALLDSFFDVLPEVLEARSGITGEP
ncbi:MAG TPA: HD domain-containing phosphohydrolase [Actinomycetota bacterium]|nr:HD domain-containing phosphohydrolase [Actinomycetota bacterium]